MVNVDDGIPEVTVADGADADRLHTLGMLASAFAGRAVAVDAQRPGDPPWTDGQTVFIDPSLPARTNLEAVAVQASMIAAGSIMPDVVRPLARHSRLAKRYLAVEGHRAMVANGDVLPKVLASVGDPGIARRSNSPAESLSLASSKEAIDDPPPEFGVIRAAKLMAADARATRQTEQEKPARVPRNRRRQELEELDDGEVDDTDDPDLFTSPVGGGGFIGKWLKKMLSSARKTGSGGGPPGADNPTHRIDSPKGGEYAVSSLAAAASEDVIDHAADLSPRGVKYPEWDLNRRSYRPDWCTVVEIDSAAKASASPAIDDAIGLRRPLARLGMGLHRRHRQPQGDDIDIDAVVEAHVEMMAGCVPSRRPRTSVRQLATPTRLVGASAAGHLGLDGRGRHGGTDRARATACGGRQPHRRATRPGRPSGALRVLLPGPVRGEHGARQNGSTTTSTAR